MQPLRVFWFLLPLALGSTAIGCGGQAGPGPTTASAEHPMIGSAAPTFTLPAQHGGGEVSLEAGRGKVRIVDFWATWCEPCRVSFPKYEALSQKFGEDLVVIGVSEDDEPDGIAAFGRETGVTFALAWDEDKSIAQSYSPEAMPTSYIVDRNGLVRFVHEGFHQGDEALIEQHVRSLM